ncbi:MAG: hypothetical protein JO316_03140 [Abitibacteriaceae bacterium]|nr:hypothetical protein [Abditibacteriaceae bacterium]MBV9864326.1 hypothetical protein [Abditibacteriaceae bacterium]
MTDILMQFEQLLPLAAAWAERQEGLILETGVPLTHTEMDDARCVRVQHPERVRLLRVAGVPMPDDPVLRAAAVEVGLMSPYTGGMALRYGIFVREDYWRERDIIAHELTHAAQYERLGGFLPFLRQYLTECLTVGYLQSPLELEAIAAAAHLP